MIIVLKKSEVIVIEANKKYIETTIRIFQTYKVDSLVIKSIADTYNKIAEKELKANNLIKLPL